MPVIGVIGAVIGVSLAVNFLALPLYAIADSLQEKERAISRKLEKRVSRIKKAFRGDERFMMLSTYYKQNDYHPLYALRSSLSILIEIPFFIAAYHYLSKSPVLSGATWWIFNDLGASDKLLSFSIGNFSLAINVLPILMTVINLASSAIYTKDASRHEKVQLYAIAMLFLVILYNSPSGLVLYWILNNIFSLVKNCTMKLKNPRKIVVIALSSLLLLVAAVIAFNNTFNLKKRILFCVFSVFAALLPIFIKILQNKMNKQCSSFTKKYQFSFSEKEGFFFMLFCGASLALLCGFVLPANVISTSPIEFSFLEKTSAHPTIYIFHSLFVFLGFFVFWPCVIFKLCGKKVRTVLPFLFFALFLCAFSNAFFFKSDYGVLTNTFALEEKMGIKKVSCAQTLLPIFVALLSCALFFILVKYKKIKIATLITFSVCIAEIFYTSRKVSHINKTFAEYAKNVGEQEVVTNIEPIFHLSKTKKNVVVIFLDRAMGVFFPYVLQEIPELEKQFEGFTFFPNCLSFGESTYMGALPLMGGYEYTPDKINKRDKELAKDKHNEASLVMPILFKNAGYSVIVTDPPFPNYTWKGDLSAFKKYNVPAIELDGKYTELFEEETGFMHFPIDVMSKNGAVHFSFMQILYPPFRLTFYDGVRESKIPAAFLNTFSSLYYLRDLTDFNANSNTFTFIDNETTHDEEFLDNDFLVPIAKNNSFKKYNFSPTVQKHLFVNCAALKQVGLWLDFLRQNNIYDNTRIIIVADHGGIFETPNASEHINSHNPLLLFKDFGENAPLKTDETFMTNADTIFIAKKDLAISDENPFTKQKLRVEKENGVNVFPTINLEWNVSEKLKDKTQFTLDESNAYHVQKNIFDESNWIPLLDWKSQN